jgi:hypothetical protein
MNQKQYESKQEEVAKLQEEINTYEQRQNKIKELKSQMSELVRCTVEHKFLYLDKTVVFVGYGYGEEGQGLLYGVAKTRPGDKYEKELGKIIAVFRAFGVPVNQVVKLVEKEYTGGFINSSVVKDARFITIPSPVNFTLKA